MILFSSLSEKTSEISKLKSEVEGKKTELSSLQRELDIQKNKNNVSCQKVSNFRTSKGVILNFEH